MTVPAGAKAGQLSLHPCHYGTEQGSYAADCGTLVVPENRAQPGSRLIALPVDADPRSLRPPGCAGLPPRRRARQVERALQGREPSGREPRRRSRRLPRRGRLGAARLPRGRLRAEALHRPARPEVLRRLHARASATAPPGSRTTGSTSAATRSRPRSTTSRLRGQALGYGKVDLVSESAGTRRAMIYAWRYPKSVHRSVMIARQPARPLPLGPEDDRRADPALLPALRAGPGVQQADGRPRGDDARGGPPTCRAASGAFRSTKRRPRRVLLRADGDGRGCSAAERTDDDLDLDVGGQGRPERALVPLADGEDGVPRVLRLGRAGRDEQGRHPRSEAVLRQRARIARTRSSATPAPSSSTPAAGSSTHGRRLPDENEYAKVRDSNVETLLVGGTLDFATPAVNATRDLLPHLPNGRQVVLSELGHTNSFWTEQPKASTRLLNTFFDTGKVDTSLYSAAEDRLHAGADPHRRSARASPARSTACR